MSLEPLHSNPTTGGQSKGYAKVIPGGRKELGCPLRPHTQLGPAGLLTWVGGVSTLDGGSRARVHPAG